MNVSLWKRNRRGQLCRSGKAGTHRQAEKNGAKADHIAEQAFLPWWGRIRGNMQYSAFELLLVCAELKARGAEHEAAES